MLIKLKGGRVIDPAHNRDEVADIYFENGRICRKPMLRSNADVTYDISGKIVMAGGVDVHSHIAGGNVNSARLLLPEHQARWRAHAMVKAPGSAGWTAHETGKRYAQMGFTTVIEPAILPEHALQAHMEMAEIPIIDTGGLAVLGNDDFLLGLLRKGAGKQEIADYIGWTLDATKCLGIKTINAGGAAAIKFNTRKFSLDDEVPMYGVSSRQIVKALQLAVKDLGVRHPLHVHCNNLGVAGNVGSALDTMDAAEGLPMHLAHIQFYGYGTEGKRGFSSATPEIAEKMAANKNVTVDVGQVLFGPTVTISCDVLRQFEGRAAASPKKWIIYDGNESGGGIVPYRYKANNYVNAIQWAIGLESVLMSQNLWNVVFSTDHPNGANFTRYPEIIHLLMDKDERERWLETVPKASRTHSHLSEIDRNLSLSEIAIITRCGPARMIGADDRGHLGDGAIADIAIYDDKTNRTEMFDKAHLVFKSGELVVENGEVVKYPKGKCIRADVRYNNNIKSRIDNFYDTIYGVSSDPYVVPETLVDDAARFEAIPCR